ncbi:unnamed protein product [Urochloa humidicola]
MQFSCPVHWCFKCGIMETKTQRELKLAACRRFPKAYHLQCLPREISFKTEDKGIIKRAWKLSKTILIYCLDHKIDKATRTARRNHIKFPATPEGRETRALGNSTVSVTGKRKNNTDQSAKYIESPDMLRREEREQAHSEAQHAAKRVKGYPQFEQSMVGAASQNGAETVEGHKKQFAISSSNATGQIPMSPSCAVSTETEKRAICMAEKGTCLETPYDVSWKCAVPSIQAPHVDKDVELCNVICRITEGKDGNEGEREQEDCSGKERGALMELHKSEEQNNVLANLYVDKHADGSQLESGKGQQNGHALEPLSGQKKGTSMRENSRSDREMMPSDDNNKLYSRCGKMALGHVDHSAAKQVHAANVKKVATTSRVGTNRGWRPDEDKEVNECCSHQYEPNCKCGDKSRKRREPVQKVTDNKVEFNNNNHNLMEDGRYAHYEDERTYRNTAAAADTSKYKGRGRSQLDRTEEHVGRNDRTRSRSYLPERRRTEHCDREPWSHVNSFRNDHYDRLNPYDGGRTDKNTEADISKYKSRGRWGSERREEPVESNSQRRSRKHSRERELIDCHYSYSGINNGHIYEPACHVKSSMNDHDVWKQHSLQSSFPAEFGTSRRHTPSPNLEDGEYRINQKRVSPCYTGRPEHDTSRRHSPPPYPRRSEDVDYTMDHSTSRDLQYDKYYSMYRGYHKVDIDPVPRYSSQDRNAGAHGPRRDLCVGEHAAGRYGERSGYVYRNVSN